MIILLVKGEPEVAEKACIDRGLEVALVPGTHSPNETHFYVVGTQDDRVTTSDLFLIIIRWYQESNALIPGYGYPDGTLLHYSG